MSNHVPLRFLTPPSLVHLASTSAPSPAPGKRDDQISPPSTACFNPSISLPTSLLTSHSNPPRRPKHVQRPCRPSTDGATPASQRLLNGRLAPDIQLHRSTDQFVSLGSVSARHVLPANMIHLCPVLRAAYHPSPIHSLRLGITSRPSGIHMLRAWWSC